jgi:hypothetical protein
LQEEAKNPELESLEQTLREELDKNIVELKYRLATEEELKALSIHERKFKKKRMTKFSGLLLSRKELKQELADLPKYDPALVANSVERVWPTRLIPNKIEIYLCKNGC